MKILITGGAGMLAAALRAELSGRGHDVVALDRRGLDVTDAAAVGEVVAGARPGAVIQCAAYTDVDGAEAREDYAREVNAVATRTLARACALTGARFVYPSSDYVFDGSARRPYRPADETRPINAYGRSKQLGERAAAEADDWLVVRTSWLYGDGGRNFVRTMIERARAIAGGEARGPLRVVDDQHGSPTWTHTAAWIIAELLERHAPSGVWHATSSGDTTWYGLAREALRLAGLDEVAIEPVSTDAFPRPAARPSYSVLDTNETKAVVGPIPEWSAALAQAVASGRF